MEAKIALELVLKQVGANTCAPANGGGVRLNIKIDAARHVCPTADTAVDRRQ